MNAHLDRLLVMEPHVLQEPDVDVAAGIVVGDVDHQPADHPGDQGTGNDQT